MLKNHLAGGVSKGALTEEQAEDKFNAWLQEKAGKVQEKEAGLSDIQAKAKADALAAEKAVNDARIAAAAPVVEEVEATEAPAEEATASNEEE
jgi:small subunit ribosomal protein S16